MLILERRAFSDGEALDFVETEKSKVVLHELESGWWILAVSLCVRCRQRTEAHIFAKVH